MKKEPFVLEMDPAVESNKIISEIVASEKKKVPRAMAVMHGKELHYSSDLPMNKLIEALVKEKISKPKSREAVESYEREVKDYLFTIYKSILMDTVVSFMDDDEAENLRKFI